MTNSSAAILLCLIAMTASFGCHHAEEASPSISDSSAEVKLQVDACRREQSTSLVVQTAVLADSLESIAKLTQLQTLELYKTTFAPEQANVLISLRGLKRLRLEDVAVDDQSANFIGTLSQLEILNLPHSKLTDAGLQALLARLPRLQLVRIGSAAITDEGIAALAEAPALRFLHLVGVPITDVGLGHFHERQDLESLYIDGGRETESGIRDLLKANPRLHFHRNQTHVAEDANADGH